MIRSGINDLIALLSPEKFTFWGTPSVTDDFKGEFDTINGRQKLTFCLMYLRHRNDNSRLEIGPCSKLIRKSQSRSCNAIITTRKYRAKLSRPKKRQSFETGSFLVFSSPHFFLSKMS